MQKENRSKAYWIRDRNQSYRLYSYVFIWIEKKIQIKEKSVDHKESERKKVW